ncbi:FdhF/YdeP family oxidoreductase [Dehalococcoidia bacterium]|nr:FdhF/YdeP family oxidoreductase [Dehalococcoidia bacterium]
MARKKGKSRWGIGFMGWRPSLWASLLPNGVGQVKPNHYKEILTTAWENKRQLPYAWRILSNGVCDGCALGTTGMRDFTISGVHLCTVRLNLLKLNTMGPMDVELLRDVNTLQAKTSGELRALGRLPFPMVRRNGDHGFTRVSWDQALDLVADRIKETDPKRISFYITSRGITNEVYYVAQKVARFLGTNNVDNSSRVCHAPSTVGLKDTLGVAASTCSYSDWLGTDLLILVGSDVPNNQPVTTKYMYYAKQQGTKILVINPYKEPGLDRYWVPSVVESAIFGTKLTDEFFLIHTGGDIAFLNGVLKHLIEQDWVEHRFLEEHTNGFPELKETLESQTWEKLEHYSGASRGTMLKFAKLYAQAKTAVFVWSMGITQHRFGVDNVKALVNLALARGMVGREGCGLMAIRGHSGVQGGAEVGATPWQFPGGASINSESAHNMEGLWGFPVPPWNGITAVETIDAAHDGNIDVLYSIGGNFLETLPEPQFVEEALKRVPLRVHQDIVVTSQMLTDTADTVVLLPAQTRYEQRGGGTETSTERRIYYNPEIAGRRIGESRAEFDILMDLAKRVRPKAAHLIHFQDSQAIRDEIAVVVPLYDGIQHLKSKGDAIQWGGPRLCEGATFQTGDGRATFTLVTPPEFNIPEGEFLMSTRRGKQFNSMVHSDKDPITGARRSDVLMNPEDAANMGLKDGDPVLVSSKAGQLRGTCKLTPMKHRNIQLHWPEGNVLLKRGATDPVCGIPDYNTTVKVAPFGTNDTSRKDNVVSL